jgi:hypothetical protein
MQCLPAEALVEVDNVDPLPEVEGDDDDWRSEMESDAASVTSRCACADKQAVRLRIRTLL